MSADWRTHVRPAGWVNPTPSGTYNLVVIGGGSAGLLASAVAAGLGGRVALVERHWLGGDCLNVGCVPSKTLLRASKVMGEMRRAQALGVGVQDPAIDFARVMGRVHDVRAGIAAHDGAERFKNLGVDVYFGDAAFAGPDRVEVAGATLKFRRALIATGSRPVAPPVPGLDAAGFLTNESVWSLNALPRRLAVIGAGPIGCELAQAFARLGAQVTVLDVAPRVLPREDEAASALVRDSLLADGITLHLGAALRAVSAGPGGRRIEAEVGGAPVVVHADEILVAAGRAPNVERLGLEAAGVAFDKAGVTIDDHARTSNPRIFAAGDVALPQKFTHTADFSARIAVQNALFFGRRKLSSLVMPWVTYTDPELARVGMIEAEAQARGIAVDTYTVPLEDVDRGRTDGEHGFVRIHTRRGGDRIVGATIVAPHAGEMINAITLAMTNNIGLRGIAATIHPYPTLSEAIRKCADAWNRTRLTPFASRALGALLRIQR